MHLANGEKISAMYQHYGANLITNLESQAEHGMVNLQALIFTLCMNLMIRLHIKY